METPSTFTRGINWSKVNLPMENYHSLLPRTSCKMGFAGALRCLNIQMNCTFIARFNKLLICPIILTIAVVVNVQHSNLLVNWLFPTCLTMTTPLFWPHAMRVRNVRRTIIGQNYILLACVTPCCPSRLIHCKQLVAIPRVIVSFHCVSAYRAKEDRVRNTMICGLP